MPQVDIFLSSIKIRCRQILIGTQHRPAYRGETQVGTGMGTHIDQHTGFRRIGTQAYRPIDTGRLVTVKA